jgi:Ion channel
MFAHLAMLDPMESSKIPLEVLGSGSVMLVMITLIHGAGLDRIVDHYRKRSQFLLERRCPPQLASVIFSYAILLMLFLHILELTIWGVVLKLSGLIPNFRDSVYFSANTYTTIGYGQMILPESWRELSPIIAISGLFTFAWTTGQMFELVSNRRALAEELSALHGNRKVLQIPRGNWEQLSEQNAKALERETVRDKHSHAAHLSAEQRSDLWQEIEAKLQQLRTGEKY